MVEFTRAQKISSLHGKLIRMVDGFDANLQIMFDQPIDGVQDELLLAGRDGEVIRLRISADRLSGEAAAAALAKAGRTQG